MFRKPPALATWLLNHLGCANQNAALLGDLLEEFGTGRSAAWYWRQTLVVIWKGAVSSAGALQSYWIARVLGFTAQFLFSMVWRWSTEKSGATELDALAAGLLPLLVIGVSLWVWRTMRRLPSKSRLRVMLLAPETSARQRSDILAAIFGDTFASYFSIYSVGSLILRHAPLGDLQAGLFGAWSFQTFLSPATPDAPPAAAKDEGESLSDEPVYRQQEPAIRVTLSDGRMVLLRPETAVQSAFEAADRELIAMLCRRGQSMEFLRRAVWLGSARQEMDHWRDPHPAIPLVELAALLDQVRRTRRVERTYYDVPPTTLWQQVRGRLRRASVRG